MAPCTQKTKQTNIAQHIRQLKEQRNLPLCTAYLEQILADSTADFEADFISKLYNELGLCHFYGEQYEKAEASYHMALQFAPNVHALYNLADFYFQTKQFEKALDECGKIKSINPEYVPSIYLAGLCRSLMGEPEKAYPYFCETIQKDPNSRGAHYWAGECALYAEDYETALEHYQKSSELNPEHFESSRGLIICLIKTGNAEKALELCDVLTEKNPFAALSLSQLRGEAFLELGNFAEAGKQHAKVAQVELDARDYLVKTASELILSHGSAKAKEYSDEILAVLPDMENAFSSLYGKFTLPQL